MLVDFWADWCQPCHMLAPVIEQAVDAHAGKVELAKLDTDHNQATAARYGVRGLPTVKAFRNGEVVDEFTGAQPPLGGRALRRGPGAVGGRRAGRAAATRSRCGARSRSTPTTRSPAASWGGCC